MTSKENTWEGDGDRKVLHLAWKKNQEFEARVEERLNSDGRTDQKTNEKTFKRSCEVFTLADCPVEDLGVCVSN